MKKKILMIADDRDIIESVRYNMEREGYRFAVAEDGASGMAEILRFSPDLLILDPMLLRSSGMGILLRDATLLRVPIILLTASAKEASDIVGLEMGADDYIDKPFSPRELGARVRALLRRSEPLVQNEVPIEIRGLTIDPTAYRVTRAGKRVPLSALEFRLLHFLASHPNKVFTRDRLLNAIWGTDHFVISRSIDVYIRRLREKIEEDSRKPEFLKTIRGAGYLFETQSA